MKWNWQQPDWSNFSWNRARFTKAEEQFLVGSGVFVGAIRHLEAEDKDQLTIESMSTEALTTSEIEGEILDRASVQSSIRRQLELNTDRRRVKPAEQGIAEMMVDLCRSFAEPLSEEMLFAWHRMLAADRRDLKDVGRYRRHEESMQVVSGPIHASKVHFEAPPSAEAPAEMQCFIAWFNRTGPQGAEPLPALTRAGIAHLYFECIHPFEDGNGRIGRAIAEKALAQNLGRPTLIVLAATILSKRKSYYEPLERTRDRDHRLAGLVRCDCDRGSTSYNGPRRVLDRQDAAARSSGGSLNERQRKALLRMLREGPEGFRGGLSAGNYITITRATTATATRDLTGMVAKGALVREGERRHARYRVNIPLRAVTPILIDGQGSVVEKQSA